MLEYLTCAEDVLAIRIRNGLGRAEMDGLIGRMERMLDRNSVTHVFVDIDRLGPDDWRAAFEALPHSLGVFRLSKYGRIAVVSDDRAVRGWSRFESAMLPKLHYEIFYSKDADRALKWVEGKITRPHEGAIKILETNNPLVLAYELDGTVTAADMDGVIAQLRPRLAHELGPISVLGRIGELTFSEPTALIHERYFQFKRNTLARVTRYAIVGGPAWLRMMVIAAESFFPFELRWFEKKDESGAWDWIGAREVGVSTRPAPKSAAMV